MSPTVPLESTLQPHTSSVQQVADSLDTDLIHGLSTYLSNARLAINLNEIGADSGVSILHILVSNIINPMTAILGTAATFTLAVNYYFDAGVLIFVLVINCAIGFAQELKSEKTMDALRRMASPTARIVRNKEIHCIATRNVAPGDIIVLELGDVVPADVRVFEAVNLEIDEALLTGESRHVQKITSQIIDSDNTCALGDRKNMAYSSTLVTKGRGKGICVKTGLETQVGMIAASISEPKSFFKTIKTPLQVSLDRMMILCFFLALILALVVFGVNNFVFKNETLLYAIGVAVAILPEGLPAVVVVTMAVGVHRMAKQKAIVRKLAALEALGQVTNICSDKTGTLTTGLMTAKHAWLGEKHYSMTGSGIEPIGDLTCNEIKVENVESNPALYYSLLNMALCGTSTLFKDGNIWKATGSPTETAIVVFAAKLKYKKDSLPDFTFLNEFPFDTSIKRMTVCYTRNSETIYFCKGALERVLEVSVNYYKQDGTIIPITDEYRKTAEQELITYAKLGMRVLALAFKTTKENTTLERNQVENNFTFLGIVAVYDPPREESLASVALAHKAGIKVHMATGDHPSTATAISLECGILKQGDDFSKLVYVASDFDKLTDIEIDRLEQLPRVLARCSPQSKVRLVKALHRRKKFVVMTGDGVNDAPAVKQADIGIAMGLAGSDVTKNASSITLTDDNFQTILSAIREGRRIFANSTRLSSHLLSGNVSEVVALIFGLAIRDVAGQTVYPMSAIQILWLNMVTSTPVALALGMEAASDDLMEAPPRSRDSSIWTRELILDVFFFGILIGIFSLGNFILTIGLTVGLYNIPTNCNSVFSNECRQIFVARGVTFYTHSLLLLIHGFNCRNLRISMFAGKVQNKYMWWAVIFGVCLVVPTAYLGVGSERVFAQVGFDFEWLYVVPELLVFIAISEGYKWIKRAYFRREAKKRLIAAEV